MRYSARQYAQALVAVLRSVSPENTSQLIRRFVHLVRRRGQAQLFPGILTAVSDLWEEHHQRIVRATISSSEAEERIRNTFSIDRSELRTTIRPWIIGGVTIRHRDTLFDASVRVQLDRLRSALKGKD